jgi:hypothetical protein
MSQFIGLNPDVLCLADLGFVYLDNGQSTLRLNSKAFDELLGARADTEVAALADHHPQFFTRCPDARAARATARAQAWHPREDALR